MGGDLALDLVLKRYRRDSLIFFKIFKHEEKFTI